MRLRFASVGCQSCPWRTSLHNTATKMYEVLSDKHITFVPTKGMMHNNASPEHYVFRCLLTKCNYQDVKGITKYDDIVKQVHETKQFVHMAERHWCSVAQNKKNTTTRQSRLRMAPLENASQKAHGRCSTFTCSPSCGPKLAWSHEPPCCRKKTKGGRRRTNKCRNFREDAWKG